MTATPQAQAEAMANSIVEKHTALMIRSDSLVAELVADISTALEKLIEENERLVNDSRNDCARYDDIAAKLTATEARLKKAREVIETMLASASPRQSEHSAMFYAWQEARAFLSTLTAEKKGTGMKLNKYLTENIETGVIDFSIRAEIVEDGAVKFYIHPASVSGDTQDYRITKSDMIVNERTLDNLVSMLSEPLTAEKKELVADIEAFLNTVAPKL